MIVDRFTKFILSVIAFSLCLNALNPWISPTLANANDDIAMERAIKKITGGINRIAGSIEEMVAIEKDLLIYWPQMEGSQNIVALLMEGSQNIVALLKDQSSKESSNIDQACSKGEKLK